jgi:predicted nucleic acid-binding protein
LLAILLEEGNRQENILAWQNATHRLGSILLEAECLVTLRRFYRKSSRQLPSRWLQARETGMKELLDEVSLKIMDRTIMEHIRKRPELSECRTLDALHLSTALEFGKNSTESITICSLDKSMRTLSKKIGFAIFPG